MARKNSASQTVVPFRPKSEVTSALPSSARVEQAILERVKGPGSGAVRLRGKLTEARTTVPLDEAQVGACVTVLLPGPGETPSSPIILGVVRALDEAPPKPASKTTARVDGKRVKIEAGKELILRCGKASLTLTRDGKVVLRGAEVLQTSSGTHRIQGATVRLN